MSHLLVLYHTGDCLQSMESALMLCVAVYVAMDCYSLALGLLLPCSSLLCYQSKGIAYNVKNVCTLASELVIGHIIYFRSHIYSSIIFRLIIVYVACSSNGSYSDEEMLTHRKILDHHN